MFRVSKRVWIGGLIALVLGLVALRSSIDRPGKEVVTEADRGPETTEPSSPGLESLETRARHELTRMRAGKEGTRYSLSVIEQFVLEGNRLEKLDTSEVELNQLVNAARIREAKAALWVLREIHGTPPDYVLKPDGLGPVSSATGLPPRSEPGVPQRSPEPLRLFDTAAAKLLTDPPSRRPVTDIYGAPNAGMRVVELYRFVEAAEAVGATQATWRYSDEDTMLLKRFVTKEAIRDQQVDVATTQAAAEASKRKLATLKAEYLRLGGQDADIGK